jgi:putative transposase
MARPLRIEYPGALYHITTRGNGRQRIFKDHQDRHYFLDLLYQVRKRFHFICHAYCLMDNHYHLIIETPEGNLSRGMRQLNGCYTQKFNVRHKKTGHVFEGRYKAIIVEKDNYLLELSRYVVLNPLRAHMVENLEDWKWSSYRSTSGIDPDPPCLTTDWLLGQFSGSKKRAQKLYALFVHGEIPQKSPWKDLKGQFFLGDKDFIEQFNFPEKDNLKEIPRSQRYANRPGLSHLLSHMTLNNRVELDALLAKAHITYGYTLKELADYLNVHYATVSRAVKRGEKENTRLQDLTP